MGGLRQQFSLEENIQMSLYGAEFLRNINHHLGIPGEAPIDVSFHPYGYLILASEKGAETMVQNSKLQNSLGAKNVVLTVEKLKRTFPWLNTDGIAVGCLGLEKEGWFDPWSLLCAFKKKAIDLGVQYINAEVKAFQYKELVESFDNNMDTIKRLANVVVSIDILSKLQTSLSNFLGNVGDLSDYSRRLTFTILLDERNVAGKKIKDPRTFISSKRRSRKI